MERGAQLDESSRFGRSEAFKKWYGYMISDKNLEIVERLERVAVDAGITILVLALSWLGSQEIVSSVIAGATTPEQIKANVNATRGDLLADVFQAVDAALGQVP